MSYLSSPRSRSYKRDEAFKLAVWTVALAFCVGVWALILWGLTSL